MGPHELQRVHRRRARIRVLWALTHMKTSCLHPAPPPLSVPYHKLTLSPPPFFIQQQGSLEVGRWGCRGD
jgi:hypothetical protein